MLWIDMTAWTASTVIDRRFTNKAVNGKFWRRFYPKGYVKITTLSNANGYHKKQVLNTPVKIIDVIKIFLWPLA